MNILLPVDGSDFTKRMLAYLAAHGELLGAGHEHVFLTVVAPIPSHAARFLDRSTLDDYYREEAEAVLRPIRAFAEQNGWKATFLHRHGHAADVIAEVSRSLPAELIVMGTHGHTALGNVALGSVATGVLARAKGPVLLIR
jgi:nucleotide-binding universal stress UspA family protein